MLSPTMIGKIDANLNIVSESVYDYAWEFVPGASYQGYPILRSSTGELAYESSAYPIALPRDVEAAVRERLAAQ